MTQISTTRAAAIFALVYAASALVQFNDPDPARWIALYSVAAALAVAVCFGRAPRVLIVSLGLGAACWAALLVPTIVTQAAFTGNEIEREFGGLALIAAGMAFLRRGARRGEPVIDSPP